MEQRASAVTSQNRDRVRTVSFYAAIALITYLLYVIARPFIVPLRPCSDPCPTSR